MKILTVLGARPQFIKASVVSHALQANERINEVLLHTGQHFDSNMSDVFFEQLGIPRPDIQLNISGGTHGAMTGRMLAEIEQAILSEKPDRVLVYGDTNSTLAGALSAVKLHIPVAHVEAGLRSFNMRMPEEINRIVTDQISDILFCPTHVAMENLEREGFKFKPVEMIRVGDVMQDAALFFGDRALPPPEFQVPANFALATLHRAENTDDSHRLSEIVAGLNEVHRSGIDVVLPLHPRTRQAISRSGVPLDVHVIEPVGYLEMLWLLQHCGLVLTDSGGVQKEAFFFGKPCITMRDQTEWVELLDAGANTLVGPDRAQIAHRAIRDFGRKIDDIHDLYGGGKASIRIAKALCDM